VAAILQEELGQDPAWKISWHWRSNTCPPAPEGRAPFGAVPVAVAAAFSVRPHHASRFGMERLVRFLAGYCVLRLFAQNALLQGPRQLWFLGVSTPVREAFAQQGNAWLNA
jgi:hypothetical protein